jgi:hypothetical protein
MVLVHWMVLARCFGRIYLAGKDLCISGWQRIPNIPDIPFLDVAVPDGAVTLTSLSFSGGRQPSELPKSRLWTAYYYDISFLLSSLGLF